MTTRRRPWVRTSGRRRRLPMALLVAALPVLGGAGVTIWRLRPRPVPVHIIADPPEGVLSIDDGPALPVTGPSTPVLLDPGTHAIRLQAPCHESIPVAIHVHRGGEVVRIRAERQKGWLDFGAFPADVSITVHHGTGREVFRFVGPAEAGPRSDGIRLPAGTYRVTIRARPDRSRVLPDDDLVLPCNGVARPLPQR